MTELITFSRALDLRLGLYSELPDKLLAKPFFSDS